MWQDLWEIGQGKDVTVYHNTGHIPLVTPRNDEAGVALGVQWPEKAPATDVAHWLRKRSRHGGANAMWTVQQRWNLLPKWGDVTDAHARCPVCRRDTPHTRCMKREHVRITRGRGPLTMWPIDYVGPLPKARGASYALTAVHVATGLFFAWPCAATDQKHTI